MESLKLEKFKANETPLNSIFGGKVWKTVNHPSDCPDRGLHEVDLYDDETGKCYDMLGKEIKDC